MKKLNIHGDLIERLNYSFIVEKLPLYEKTWEKIFAKKYTFISEQEKKLLRKIAEYQFTCLESLVCMKRVSTKQHASNLSEKYKIGEKEFLDAYLGLVDDFFVFESHMGRIFETMKRIWRELKLSEKSDIKEFYHHRHNVIHSHKLPFKIDEKLIAIPELKAQGILDGWNDKINQTWEEFMDSENFQPLDYYLEDTFERLCGSVNNCLHPILSKLSELTRKLGGFDFEFTDFERQDFPEDYSSPSGADIDYPFENHLNG